MKENIFNHPHYFLSYGVSNNLIVCNKETEGRSREYSGPIAFDPGSRRKKYTLGPFSIDWEWQKTYITTVIGSGDSTGPASYDNYCCSCFPKLY